MQPLQKADDGNVSITVYIVVQITTTNGKAKLPIHFDQLDTM